MCRPKRPVVLRLGNPVLGCAQPRSQLKPDILTISSGNQRCAGASSGRLMRGRGAKLPISIFRDIVLETKSGSILRPRKLTNATKQSLFRGATCCKFSRVSLRAAGVTRPGGSNTAWWALISAPPVVSPFLDHQQSTTDRRDKSCCHSASRSVSPKWKFTSAQKRMDCPKPPHHITHTHT